MAHQGMLCGKENVVAQRGCGGSSGNVVWQRECGGIDNIVAQRECGGIVAQR